MKNREAAIAAIRTCKTRESLDDILKRFEITDSQKIIEYLDESMYKPHKFSSSPFATAEEELEITKQIFFVGVWRLNEYYERKERYKNG